METDKIRSIIGSGYWKFAKTIPHIPHFFALRMHAARDEDFVGFTRGNGYGENWGRRAHSCVDLGGWRFWTIGTRLGSTVLFCRARQERPPRPITENPRSFRAPVDCHEIHCVKTPEVMLEQKELNLDGGDE